MTNTSDGDIANQYLIYYPSLNAHAAVIQQNERLHRVEKSRDANYGPIIETPVRISIESNFNDDNFQFVEDTTGNEKLVYQGAIAATVIKTNIQTGRTLSSETLNYNIAEFNACASPKQSTANINPLYYANRLPKVSDANCVINNLNQKTVVEISEQYISSFELRNLDNPIHNGVEILTHNGAHKNILVSYRENGRQAHTRLELKRLNDTSVAIKNTGLTLSQLTESVIVLPEAVFDVTLYKGFGAGSIVAEFRLNSGKFLYVLLTDSHALNTSEKAQGLSTKSFTLKPFRNQNDLKAQNCVVYGHMSKCE